MEIRTFAESMQFRVDAPHAAIGTVDGYVATFFAGRSGFSIVPYFTFLLDGPVEPALLDDVRLSLRNYRFDAEAEGDVLVLSFREALAILRPDAVGPIRDGLTRTAAAMRRHGAAQSPICRLCGKPGADDYHYRGGVHRPVHGVCLREYLATEEPPSPAKPVVDGTLLVRSVVWAIAFGLLAAAPAVLAAVWIPYLFPLLFALVPLGTFSGYRIGGSVWNAPALRWLSAYDVFLAVAGLAILYRAAAVSAGATFFAHVGANLVPFSLDALAVTVVGFVATVAARRILPIRKL